MAVDSRSRTSVQRPTSRPRTRRSGAGDRSSPFSTPDVASTTWFDGGVVKRPRHASTATRSATPSPRPIPRCMATSRARSTDPSTGSRDMARSSPASCTKPARTPTILSWRGIPATRATGRVGVADRAGADRRAGAPAPRTVMPVGMRSTYSACPWATTTRTPTDQLFDPILLDAARRARQARGRRGVLRGQRRDRSSVLPGGLRTLDRTAEARCTSPARPGARASPWAPSTPTRPTRCSPTPGRGCAAYAPGASLMSTMPPFEGGLEPIARTQVDDRVRESIDPDDFRSGVDADGRPNGRVRTVERHVVRRTRGGGRDRGSVGVGRLMNGPSPSDTPAAAVRRGWEAVAARTDLRRPE